MLLKDQGDAALRDGRFNDALALYAAAAQGQPCEPRLLLNYALAALKLCSWEVALRAATTAAEVLDGQGCDAAWPPDWQYDKGTSFAHAPPQRRRAAQPRVLLAKALHRRGVALLALGRAEEALAAHRASALAWPCRGDQAAAAALCAAAAALTPEHLAELWAVRIEAAQAPLLMSSRDGRLLRLVPMETRLAPDALRGALTLAASGRLAAEARNLLCGAWRRGMEPGRAEVALVRAYAYLLASRPAQALKDARVAMGYGPKSGGRCCWARALAAHSAALEGLHDNLIALLAMQRAAEPEFDFAQIVYPSWSPTLHKSAKDNLMAALAMQRAIELEPGCAEFAEDLERLHRRIPYEQAELLQASGSAGLEAWLAAEADRRVPDYKKVWPKYYYYYEWMRERIAAACGELPAPVLDKLLAQDATELDTRLTYPKAIRAQAEQLSEVLQRDGPDYLATWRPPMLTWAELQQLKAEAASGSALEGPQPGEQVKIAAARPQAIISAAVHVEDNDSPATFKPDSSALPFTPGNGAEQDGAPKFTEVEDDDEWLEGVV
ncbi:hypothetical protein WJX81_004270 [Elliptochloris bilobata]|uniref:Uncharacterized protein n=1 Tax=Elliptochloris bilobata TaxID=381761 RepID=A0AAW1SCS4_9CHLO